MPVSQQIKNQHLLSRAGFGIQATDISFLLKTKTKDLYQLLVKSSAEKPIAFDVVSDSLKGLFMGIGDAVKMEELKKNGVDNETKRKIRVQSREDLKSLNLEWLNEMAESKAALREKMSFFWHGHFATRDVNIFYQQLLLQEIRLNALSNFGDLLKAVSKSASMLGFLNNQQNRKKKPNENFAREVLELFTLGRGNYTEQDIKEAARAFTGWGFNFKGEFEFRKFQHDDGVKTFMGQTGNFDGDDILNIILARRQTATFITKKVYKFFVNDEINTSHIDWLSKRFFDNKYDIASLMQDIFTSNWFYDEKNISAKIKSPIELLVGIRKLLPMEIENPQIQIVIQRALGQLLFYPPNVAGWPGGKNWIDSSSLMFRLQIPRLIKDNGEIAISTKADDDQQMGMKENIIKSNLKNVGNQGYKINASINWQAFTMQFDDVKRENLLQAIMQIILPLNHQKIKQEIVENIVDKSSREAYIKTATIALMSTPEFQLI